MQITLRMTTSGHKGPLFTITVHSLVIADVEPAEEVEGFKIVSYKALRPNSLTFISLVQIVCLFAVSNRWRI